MPAFWTNEYEVPLDLLELLNEPTLPDGLRDLIIKAKNEVNNDGAVAYTTKANIERNMNEYKNYWTILHRNDIDND